MDGKGNCRDWGEMLPDVTGVAGLRGDVGTGDNEASGGKAGAQLDIM